MDFSNSPSDLQSPMARPVPEQPHDVRMRGFSHRAMVEDALTWVREVSQPLAPEQVSLATVAGRILAEDVVSPIDVPPFDRSAMDGFATVAAATEGASLYNPLTFRVIGEALPGMRFKGRIDPETTIRIMTGAPVPPGADCVVPAEHATEADGHVELTRPMPTGRHIGRRGEDVQAGQTILTAGRRLRPQDLGLLSSVGCETAPVHARPRVRLLVTGNELVVPGRDRDSDQIYESNSSMLAALVSRDGGLLENNQPVEAVPDDRKAIADELSREGVEVILVSGGSSVGTEDHAPGLLSELGEITFHGLAMRPSSPAGMGRIGKALVFLLPGNPVSCLCAYDFFAGEAIRRLCGDSPTWPYRPIDGQLSQKITSDIGRLDYVRVRVTSGVPHQVEPLALSGASILSSTTRADGFVIVPVSLEGYPEEAPVQVWCYSDPPPLPVETHD